MKILIVNWMDLANPASGGAEVHLMEIFTRFVKKGHDVTLVCSGFPGGKTVDKYEGIRIFRTGSRETFNFFAPGLIRKLEKHEKFDLIVEDINKVPLFIPLFSSTPVLVIIPHLFGSAIFHETGFIPALYVYMMEKPIPLVYRKCFFEVISESTGKDMIRRSISSDRIRIAHCGMDHSVYSIDPGCEKFEEPTLLYVGRLKKYKGVDIIIRAMPEILKSVPGTRLAVVGSGDYAGELERLSEKLGVKENLVFTGFVSTDEKVSWMRKSHIIVNPSPKEGWGLTNIEANACGTPAIASDTDGLRDSVRDGITGFLYPYGDHSQLAGKAVTLLKNRELYDKITSNAVEWSKTFTWEKNAEMTMEIIESIIK